MPNRLVFNDYPETLNVQIYGSDSEHPILTENGAMVVSGTLNIDTTIPLSVNVVEITPVSITGIVPVTINDPVNVNVVLPSITIVETTIFTNAFPLHDRSATFNVSYLNDYSFYVYAASGTSITAFLYNSPVMEESLILAALVAGPTLLASANSITTDLQVATLRSDYVAQSAFVDLESPPGQTVIVYFVGQ